MSFDYSPFNKITRISSNANTKNSINFYYKNLKSLSQKNPSKKENLSKASLFFEIESLYYIKKLIKVDIFKKKWTGF